MPNDSKAETPSTRTGHTTRPGQEARNASGPAQTVAVTNATAEARAANQASGDAISTTGAQTPPLGKREAQALGTRTRLIAAARELFATQGYADTSTGQVLEQTGVARGALYHHFTDKAELFAAVCETLHGEVTAALIRAVAATSAEGGDAFAQLLVGCDAWMDAMASGDARRLLVIEAPAVLGWERWNDLDQQHGVALLRAGIRAAQAEGSLPPIPADDLTTLLNGAMNHAVMMARGPDAPAQLERSKQALHAILHALRVQATSGSSPDLPAESS